MIVTVTPNTGLDRILFVPSFQLNHTMRASQWMMSMGGKGADASWILGEMGTPSLALGFAAGLTGQQMVMMLRARGVTTDFTPVGGETRVNTVMITEDTGDHATITVSSLDVSAEQVDDLRGRYASALKQATCVLLGGTLPPGVDVSLYTEFVRAARERNIPIILDASGPALQAGLKARPDFIKPNRDELSAFVGYPIESPETAYRAGRAIYAEYGTSAIITLGADGALAVLPDSTYFIPALRVKVVNPAGTGDAVSAGLAWGLSGRKPIETGLRLGFAAAGAVLLTPGTADCRRADVERLLPQIELLPYP